MARQREETLRSEQLMALGTAAAQVTHHLATPVANLQLIHEELVDELGENHELVEAMALPLIQCSEQLSHFRQYASQIKENKVTERAVATVLDEFLDACLLHFPEQIIELKNKTSKDAEIKSDSLFLSALINIVQNAVDANRLNGKNCIDILVSSAQNTLQIDIVDQGSGIDLSLLDSLGHKTISSEKGMGIALFLTNTTINKIGGQLMMSNVEKGGAKASIRVPLV